MNLNITKLPADDFKTLISSWKAIEEQLSFLASGQDCSLHQTYKVSDGDINFIHTAITEMRQLKATSNYYPNVEDVDARFQLGLQLQRLENYAEEIFMQIRKNRVAAFSDSYKASSIWYAILKRARKSGLERESAAYNRLRHYHLNKWKKGQVSGG